MNAAFLMMSTAWMAGADAAPAPAPAPAPVVVHSAPVVAGCGDNCAAGAHYCGDPCPTERKGLLGRLFRKKRGDDCGCDSAPVYSGFTTAACDDCSGNGGGLFSRLRNRFHKSSTAAYAGDCGCWGGASYGGCGSTLGGTGGCALPPVPGTTTPAPTTTPPVEMPKPKDPPKTTGSGAALLSIPQVVTPVANPSAPVLGGTKNPF